jgi:hypothetical protein
LYDEVDEDEVYVYVVELSYKVKKKTFLTFDFFVVILFEILV